MRQYIETNGKFTVNKAWVMTDAHQIARRIGGGKAGLARGLRSAWTSAKMEVRVQIEVRAGQKRFEALAAKGPEILRDMINELENKDRHTGIDRQMLENLHAAGRLIVIKG
tara:strand:+ start:25286 stop:25618 length:333 start_codon:yes stop_codon:yes gene_type:complete